MILSPDPLRHEVLSGHDATITIVSIVADAAAVWVILSRWQRNTVTKIMVMAAGETLNYIAIPLLWPLMDLCGSWLYDENYSGSGGAAIAIPILLYTIVKFFLYHFMLNTIDEVPDEEDDQPHETPSPARNIYPAAVCAAASGVIITVIIWFV